MKIYILLSFMYSFLGPGIWGGGGGHKGITGDEIAGLGAGAAALIGVIGYLILRRRNSPGK